MIAHDLRHRTFGKLGGARMSIQALRFALEQEGLIDKPVHPDDDETYADVIERIEADIAATIAVVEEYDPWPDMVKKQKETGQ